ncbi:MAG: TonB-dependent receptor domain-containing protein [Vicinamibacteria bacterium]
MPNTTEEQELGRDGRRALDSESVIASWRRALSSKSLVSASFYQRNVWDDLHPTSDPVTSFADASRSTLTVGSKVDWYYSLSGHRWKGGVDVSVLRLRESFEFDARGHGSDDSNHGEEDEDSNHGEANQGSHHGGGLEEISFEDRRTGHVLGLYLQDGLTLFTNLTLDLGIRFDQFDIVGTESQVSPRLGAAYHFPEAGTVVRGSYNRLFTPPPIEYVLLASYVGNLPVDEGEPVGISLERLRGRDRPSLWKWHAGGGRRARDLYLPSGAYDARYHDPNRLMALGRTPGPFRARRDEPDGQRLPNRQGERVHANPVRAAPDGPQSDSLEFLRRFRAAVAVFQRA